MSAWYRFEVAVIQLGLFAISVKYAGEVEVKLYQGVGSVLQSPRVDNKLDSCHIDIPGMKGDFIRCFGI
jgi:hypothetical protein